MAQDNARETDRTIPKPPETPDGKTMCTKPFDPENARGADPDEPCDNGER